MQTNICVMNKKQLFHWTMRKKHVFCYGNTNYFIKPYAKNSVVVENANYFIRPYAKT